MAHGPQIPDGPRLDLDPDMSEAEQAEQLEAHFFELVRVHRELSHRLERAREALEARSKDADRLERENAVLKTAPSYVATVEELLDTEAVIRQHGSNQEILTEVPQAFVDDLTPGDRVGVSDSFAIETRLSEDTDARTRAMELEEAPPVTYRDIGGLEAELVEIRETVELPLQRPELFEAVGIDPPSGVLLHGPPGTGKTLLARAVANQTDATFIKMTGSELVQKFIGEGAKLVRDLFEVGERRAPSIIFIDELDAIAGKRTESKTAGDAEVQRTMMQLLSKMDGFEERGEIRIIGATNRFDMLDRAILRPGRFDRIIEVPKPDQDGRERIFEIHTRAMNVTEDVDFGTLAAEAEAASGADIKAICTEAGMFAIRDERTEVRMADFLGATAKIRSTETVGRPVTGYLY